MISARSCTYPVGSSSGYVTPAFVFLRSGEVPCGRLTISQADLITCIKHILSQEEIINQTDNRICMKMAVNMRLDCGFFSFTHCIHSLCIETSHLLTIRVHNITDDSLLDYRQTRRTITDDLHTGICKQAVLPRQSYDTRKLARDSKQDTSDHKRTAQSSQDPLAINGTHR
jgi:hypothetical protein